MSTVAEVRLWGRTIGAVLLEQGREIATFEYDGGFSRSGIQVAPLAMPLSRQVYQFPELSRQSFHGLPGLLADSLPDKFGNALINAWLATRGRQPDSFNAIERLCYTGARGMGALEFRPALAVGPAEHRARPIDVDSLVELASEILTERSGLTASFGDDGKATALRDILRVGTSAGGARAKAVIAWNPQTNEVRSGQLGVDDPFEHWLMKFDGVIGNRDKELVDPAGYGVIEYAYSQMAIACGIEMNECRLLEESGRRHFMTRRFDRPGAGEKLHMQSLSAMAHFDFNLAGAYSYEQAFLIIRQLGLPMRSIEEQFRRMAFNVIARNQDDHVKNIAFLMNKSGEWSLSPAFDMTYSFNPDGAWTRTHQMTMNGKRADFVIDDFKACAKVALMKRGRAETIVAEVQAVVARWKSFAESAGLAEAIAERVEENLLTAPFA